MAITELTDGLPNADGQQSARRDGHHQARSATEHGILDFISGAGNDGKMISAFVPLASFTFRA
ncbi:MAG: hypothetical protein IPI49_15560 [Myxococcales bacterium]|nr:hypothetical protein [Myxococcales bacterium]